MARGELSLKDSGRIHSAVAAAEAATGVELCVAIAHAGESDPVLFTDAAFSDLGLAGRKAALVMVMPDVRRIEVRTSATAAEVLPEDLCAKVVAELRIPLSRDALAEGIERGMAVLSGATVAPAATAE